MKYIFKTFILFLMMSLVSCDKDLQEVNIDPNTSPTANESQVLTSAQGFLGYIQDVDLNSQSFLWAQYYTWGIGVSLGNAERFVAEPDDHDRYWERAYANSLTDLKFLTKSESAAFRGVAGVLQAHIYQGLVDHFGSVPYSEAIAGEIEDGSILTPKFDDGASIYGNLVGVLDAALADLAVGNSADIGSEDLIFGGDLSKWTKYANSLKLRILMRTSETSPNGDAIKALVSGGNFITTSADIPAIPFSGGPGDQNPMYARFEWGVGDFYFASNATLNPLNDSGDPRTTAFYSPATTGTFMGAVRGIDQGCIDDCVGFTEPSSDYSGSSANAYGVSNSVLLMSDWEVWFLRAEAAARYGTADNDSDAFATAVANNFEYHGVAGGSDFADGLGYGGSMDEKLDMIGMQKWISMNGTQEDEGWIESRRFDRPASRLFTEGVFQDPPYSIIPAGTYPASWLFPASERSLNPNAPSQRAITDRIFWDN